MPQPRKDDAKEDSTQVLNSTDYALFKHKR